MKTEKPGETLLGKALVRALQEDGGIDHPAAEDLAELIDGRLGPDDRIRLMGHLASCDRCYELFQMSSEMAQEQQPAKQTTRPEVTLSDGYRKLLEKMRGMSLMPRFNIPSAAAAVLLIAFGVFLAYKNLQPPSSDVIALKVAPQKEATPVLAPAEIKKTPPSLIASAGGDKQEGTKSSESIRKEKPAPVYYARVEVNDAVGEFLNDTPDDLVTDKKQIGQLVAMLVRDDRTIGRYDISEVRIEHGETIMRSARTFPGKAEIRIRDGVLTIRLVD